MSSGGDLPLQREDISLLENDCKPYVTHDDGDLKEFSSFDADVNGVDGRDQGRNIDPQLLVNPSFPTESGIREVFDEYNANSTTSFGHHHNSYPEFDAPGSAPASPYFSQSIELPLTKTQIRLQPSYTPSPLQNQSHRRSVSEPPGGLYSSTTCAHESFPLGLNLMPTFHREGYEFAIGKPTKRNELDAAKALTRCRPVNSIEKPRAYKRRKGQQTQTQQVRPAAPTSAPSSFPLFSPQTGVVMTDWTKMQHPIPSGYVTSRICTPTPSPERLISLSEPTTPMRGKNNKRASQAKATISITLSIAELRVLIREEVQEGIKAVCLSKKRKFEDSAVGANQAEIDRMSLDELLGVEKGANCE